VKEPTYGAKHLSPVFAWPLPCLHGLRSRPWRRRRLSSYRSMAIKCVSALCL